MLLEENHATRLARNKFKEQKKTTQTRQQNKTILDRKKNGQNKFAQISDKPYTEQRTMHVIYRIFHGISKKMSSRFVD